MDREIFSHETRHAFARVGAKVMGGGFGLKYFSLRDEMAKAGIETTEILESTWAAKQTESRPIIDRFQGYYNKIDWRSRDDVWRIVPVFEKIILAVLDHYEPSFLNDIATNLDQDGFRINGTGKICRKKPESALDDDVS